MAAAVIRPGDHGAADHHDNDRAAVKGSRKPDSAMMLPVGLSVSLWIVFLPLLLISTPAWNDARESFVP